MKNLLWKYNLMLFYPRKWNMLVRVGKELNKKPEDLKESAEVVWKIFKRS